MASHLKSARPAQRKGSTKTTRSTKKSLETSAPRLAAPASAVVVERPSKPLPPKVIGELPVPRSTFYL